MTIEKQEHKANTLQNSMKDESDKPHIRRRVILWYVLASLSGVLLLSGPPIYFAIQSWIGINWGLGFVELLSTECAKINSFNDASLKKAEVCSAIIRNFALMVGMAVSTFGLMLGLLLALWGRYIQNRQWKTQEKQWKTQNDQWITQDAQWEEQRRRSDIEDNRWELQYRSNSQERYEKLGDRLSSDLEVTRSDACRSLFDLSIADETMKEQCLQLLFDFIRNPPLKDYDRGKDFIEIFPENKSLRLDIQSAIDNFFGIYKKYSMTSVYDKPIEFPNYFWKNVHKGLLFLERANLRRVELKSANLEKANLRGADLQEANLFSANLRGANLIQAKLQNTNLWAIKLQEADLRGANLQGAYLLEANLQKANLHKADLQGADISSALMQETENLTKEQVLLAKWGYGSIYPTMAKPPELPENLIQDEEIKKWLESPDFDNREPEASE